MICTLLLALAAQAPAPDGQLFTYTLRTQGRLADADAFREVFNRQEEGVRFLELERQLFGMDHTQIGRQVLQRWDLPEHFWRVASEHHAPTINNDDGLIGGLLAAVILGDTFATVIGEGFDFKVEQSPRAASQMLVALDMVLGPTPEIVVLGDAAHDDTAAVLAAIGTHFLPNRVVACRAPDAGEGGPLDPLFAGKSLTGEPPAVFVCENFACQAPVFGRAAGLAAIERLAEPPAKSS